MNIKLLLLVTILQQSIATNIPDFECFTNKKELRQAIKTAFPAENDCPSGENVRALIDTVVKYGWPMNTWCFDNDLTDMSELFEGRDAFNEDISDWNVSWVTNMERMFHDSSFNQDVSIWDVSSVTNMHQMFAGSSFNQDVSMWDVSKVTNMGGMFGFAEDFNQNLCNWGLYYNEGNSYEGMFYYSDCESSYQDDPMSAQGPYCYPCEQEEQGVPEMQP